MKTEDIQEIIEDIKNAQEIVHEASLKMSNILPTEYNIGYSDGIFSTIYSILEKHKTNLLLKQELFKND